MGRVFSLRTDTMPPYVSAFAISNALLRDFFVSLHFFFKDRVKQLDNLADLFGILS